MSMKRALALAICFAVQNSIYLPAANSIYGFAIRYDINPRLRSKHIECEAHIDSRREISKILQGIYIAANKKSPGEIREIFLLAISP